MIAASSNYKCNHVHCLEVGKGSIVIDTDNYTRTQAHYLTHFVANLYIKGKLNEIKHINPSHICQPIHTTHMCMWSTCAVRHQGRMAVDHNNQH